MPVRFCPNSQSLSFVFWLSVAATSTTSNATAPHAILGPCSLTLSMQTQLCRFLLTSRACSNVAACMPSLSVSPRVLSSLSSLLPETLRPKEALPDLWEGLKAVQPLGWQHMTQLTPLTDRHSCAPESVPVSAACMPLVPAQLQAAIRAVQVQHLACMSSSIPGLQGELPQAVHDYRHKATRFNSTTCCADHQIEAHIDEMLCATKRTYQPSVIIRKRRHGFLNRYPCNTFTHVTIHSAVPCNCMQRSPAMLIASQSLSNYLAVLQSEHSRRT